MINISGVNTDNSLNTECPICHNSHWLHPLIDGKPDYGQVVACKCVKEKWEEERRRGLLKSCRFPLFAETMSFETFKVYPEVRGAYQEALQMARKPGEVAWLAFIGTNGNGKTHLGVSICKEWIKAGVPARYVFTSILLGELKEGFKKTDDDSYAEKFRYYCNVPLLMLDDCGVESKTPWVQENLDTLVDYRLMNNLSLIVTSNLSLDELPNRIKSRLMRHPKGKVIAILAGDYSMRVRNR